MIDLWGGPSNLPIWADRINHGLRNDLGGDDSGEDDVDGDVFFLIEKSVIVPGRVVRKTDNFQDWSHAQRKIQHLDQDRQWMTEKECFLDFSYSCFGSTVFGIGRMRVHSGNAGCGNNLSSGRGILAHKMDSKLGAVDNSLIVNVGTVGVGSWRDSGPVSSTNPSQWLKDKHTRPSLGGSKYRLNFDRRCQRWPEGHQSCRTC